MRRNLVIGMIIAVAVIALGITGYAILAKNNEIKTNTENTINNEAEINSESQNVIQVKTDKAPKIETRNEAPLNKELVANNKVEEKKEEPIDEPSKGDENGKILVVYFSAQSHTKSVAEKIANNLNADIFEIVPKDTYSSEDLDWSDSNSRVSREHNDETLRNVELKNASVDNWDTYDTVLIGYPIWWGVAAWPVNNFVRANDFSGKTVIPFCTSASSDLGESGKLLEQETNTGNWLEGHRFSSNPSYDKISEWIETILKQT